MEQKLIQSQTQTQETVLSTDTYWDSRLTKTKSNLFPLAPKNLIEKGMIDEDMYNKENKKWGNFVSSTMESQPSLGSICILGAGLARDLTWLFSKLLRKKVITIVDSSAVARNNVTELFKEHGYLRKLKVVQKDIFEAWDGENVCDKDIDTYFMSQFLQHMGNRMGEFMQHLGKFLKIPSRRVYMVTPLPEDNDPSEVSWVHSILFSENDWKIELEKGLEGPSEVQVLGKDSYFNQTYTIFKVKALV